MKKLISVIILLCALSAMSLRAQSASSLLINWDTESIAKGSSQTDAAEFAMSEHKSVNDAVYGTWAPESANCSIIGATASFIFGESIALRIQGVNIKDKIASKSFNQLGAPTGEFFPEDMIIAAGLAYRFADAFSVGVDIKSFSSKIGKELAGNSFAADISAAYSKNGVRAGVSLRNLGSKISYGGGTAYDLPMLVRANGAYSVAGFTASAEVNYLFSGALMAGVGAEYSIKDIVFLRAGYHYGNEKKAVPSFASCGLGLEFYGIRLNAAYLLGSKTLGGTMLFGLGYEF